jgi:hypothetical protein
MPGGEVVADDLSKGPSIRQRANRSRGTAHRAPQRIDLPLLADGIYTAPMFCNANRGTALVGQLPHFEGKQ